MVSILSTQEKLIHTVCVSVSVRVSFVPLHSFAKRVPENRQSLPKPLFCLHQQWIPRYSNEYKYDIIIWSDLGIFPAASCAISLCCFWLHL